MTFLVFSVFPAPDSPLFISTIKNYDRRDKDRLIFAHFQHIVEGNVRGCKDMRFRITSTLFFVQVDII